jgi:tetratricopeptide (TPR) repeat protein
MLALLSTAGVDRKAAKLNNQANELYDAKKFEEAGAIYDEAATRAPEAAAIDYNRGNALLQQGKVQEAAEALRRASQSEDPALRQRSFYNLGNALYGAQKLPEAVAAYRQSLLLDPRDRDAKINFEKALLELQQQQQQQQQQGQQNKDGKQDQQGQQGQQGQGKPDEQDQQGEKQQGQQGQDQDREAQEQQAQESKPDEQQQAEQQPAALDSVPAGELSREEALRILEAMRQQEQELQAERARKNMRTRRAEKDW